MEATMPSSSSRPASAAARALVEAARLGVPLRPIRAMAQRQEPGGAGSAARGRGRVALTKPRFRSANERPIVPKPFLELA
jgi:hypothetical protein